MKQNLAISIFVVCSIFITLLIGWDVLTPKQQIIQKPIATTPPAYVYPLNTEIVGYLGSTSLEDSFVTMGDKLVAVVYRVVFDDSKQQYIYHYKLTSSAKEKFLLSWEVLTVALQKSSDPASQTQNFVIELEPGQSKELVFANKLPPTFFVGKAWIYKKKTISAIDVLELINLNSQFGPLPKTVKIED